MLFLHHLAVYALYFRTPTRKSKQYTVETGSGSTGGASSFSSPGGAGRNGRVGASLEPPLQPSGSNKLEAMLARDDKLSKAESLTAKFLEAADGYHRIVKKTIERRGHKGGGASGSNSNSPPPR